MNARTIHEVLKAKPFKPFRLVMAEGVPYEIARSVAAFVTTDRVVVGIDIADDGIPYGFKI